MRNHMVCFGLLASTSAANATVVLRGGTGDAAFRVKTVSAKTRIENGVATTSLVWTFADSRRNWKPEVEFFYGAPPRGVVTFFAYWFRGERVVARVVEKEKAASIYAQLSSWGVDPALIELDGKNTFRARIFPVEANQDVRVEMHLVEPLKSTADGQGWSLPLLQKFVSPRQLSKYLPVSKVSAPFYDELKIEVESREKGVVSFPGARFSAGKWRFSAKNVAADRDFSLQFPQPKPQLRADLFSSRASGQDGYFSLLLTPAQALKNPRLQISGVRVSDVFPTVIPTLKAGENISICGRYRGAGAATITLSDATHSMATRAQFSARSGANNPAAKLWAARQIAALGALETNRSRVIALSKRWSLPSAQTSWLAVPASEKTNFEATKREANDFQIARELASDLVLNRSASAQKNRVKLDKFYNPSYGSRQSFLKVRTEIALDDLASELARAHQSEAIETKPNVRQLAALRAQLVAAIAIKRRLTKEADPVPLEGYLMTAERELAQKRSQQIAPEYVEAVLTEGEDSSRARELRKQLARMEKHLERTRYEGHRQFDYAQGAFHERLRLPLHQLAYQKQLEEARLNPNRTKIREIDADMNRLFGWVGAERKNEFLAWQSGAARRDATAELLDEYAAENQKAGGDAAKMRRIYKRVGELVEKQRPIFAGVTPKPGDSLYEQYIRPYAQNPLDAPEIKAARKSGDKRELLAQISRKQQFFARPGDPLIEVNAPADCAHVIAILPSGEIKKLTFNSISKQWEARFDVPGYAAENAHRIQILIVEKSGTRRRLTLDFGVDTTSPEARARIQNRDGLPLLRVETEAQTDRVSAFLPWNQRIELQRQSAGSFSAALDVPAAWRGQKAKIRLVLTDAAHNRTEISVDWN